MTTEANESFFDELDDMAGCFELENLEKVLAQAEKIDVTKIDDSLKCGILRRKGEWLYAMSNYENDKKKRIEYLEKAYETAKEGHLLDSSDFECCKVLCSTSGRLAEESGIKKRIHYGFEFKTHLDHAIAINENDFETLHMRGRFSYTVASLSMVERIAAKVIGQIPDVSLQDALDDLVKAEDILPGVAENQLFIGKTYFSLGDYKNAKKWLKIASKNETDVVVEQEHVAEALELLKDKRLK